MNPTAADRDRPSRRFADGLIAAAAATLGRPLPRGTTVVADDSRAGSRLAVAYVLPHHTIVWCDPAVGGPLSSLAGPEPLTVDAFLERTQAVGGEEYGRAIQRVLDGPLVEPGTGLVVRSFDPEDPDDVRRLEGFVSVCPDDDLGDAELDLAELDPVASVNVEGGEILAYASARPWTYGPAFDDIGVITRPDARCHGRGAAVVAHLAARSRRTGRLPLHRCDDDNLGSNRLAESLGFTVASTLAAARFATDPPVGA